MPRPALATLIVAIAATTVTSCSSDTTTTTTPDTAQTVATDAQLHDQLPPRLKNGGTLVMATDATIGAPFASFTTGNKTIVGLNVDMARALAQTLGVGLKVVNTPFGTFIPGLQAGRYDLSVSVMLDTKEREKVVDFIDYIKDGSGFLVRSDDSRTDLALTGLCGMRAGAINGSVEQQALTKQSNRCTSGGSKPIQLNIFAENAQGILALTSGRIDVWAGSSDQNAWFTQQNNGQIKQSGQPFGTALAGIAMPKGSPLVPMMQKAMQKLMENGTYLKILKRYGVQDGALSEATLNHAQY